MVKAIKLLHKKGEISEDIILMADGQKSMQYQGAEYIGADEDGNIYKKVHPFCCTGFAIGHIQWCLVILKK